MTYVEKRKKVLNTIDLTGDEPVSTTKTIEEEVAVVTLDGDVNANNEYIPVQKINILKCEICLAELSKYTCPACRLKTCCLACVQRHKRMTGCTGERDVTGFIARSKFDNIHLLNDYRFLEEAHRISDNAKRDYKAKPNQHNTKQGTILQKAALKHGVKLFRMAKGMKRWKQNRSRFHIKEDTIHWTVKFVFNDVKEEIVTKFPESETLESILSQYINKEKASPENCVKFSPYIRGNSDIHILFKQELHPGPTNRRYTEVEVTNTIQESLDGKTVLEYPTYHVTLSKTFQQLIVEPFIKEPDNDEDSDDNDDNDEACDSPEYGDIATVDPETSPSAKRRRKDDD